MCGACLFFAVALPGCNTQKKTDPAKKNAQAKTDQKDHKGHAEVGAHGGPFAEWEPGYHAEFTVDHDAKTATIYILDEDLKDTKLDAAKITKVTLTITSAKPEVSIDLKHDAKLSGDKMTVLTGVHEELAKKADLKGNIKGTVDGKPFEGDFAYEAKKKDNAK
jgi:hypothetical protein